MINRGFLPVIGNRIAPGFTIQGYFLLFWVSWEYDIIWFLHKHRPIVHAFCKDQDKHI